MSGYTLTRRAADDLQAIIAYVESNFGPETARRVAKTYVDMFSMLATMPRAGWEYPAWKPGARFLPVHRYVIMYDPDTDPVEIMRILPAASDLNRLAL